MFFHIFSCFSIVYCLKTNFVHGNSCAIYSRPLAPAGSAGRAPPWAPALPSVPVTQNKDKKTATSLTSDQHLQSTSVLTYYCLTAQPRPTKQQVIIVGGGTPPSSHYTHTHTSQVVASRWDCRTTRPPKIAAPRAPPKTSSKYSEDQLHEKLQVSTKIIDSCKQRNSYRTLSLQDFRHEASLPCCRYSLCAPAAVLNGYCSRLMQQHQSTLPCQYLKVSFFYPRCSHLLRKSPVK